MLLMPGIVFAAWHHLISIPERYNKTLISFTSRVNYQEIALWLRKNSTYSDVYLSKQISIQANPPQAIALSRKAVHTFSSRDELKKFYLNTGKNANYYAILDMAELNRCGIIQAPVIATLHSGNNNWVIFKFTPGLEGKIDECLTTTQA